MLNVSIRRIAFLLSLGFALGLNAKANLITDPNFTSVTYTGAKPLTTLYGEFGTGTGSQLTVAGWATTGYNFVYAPGTADAGTQANGANAGQPNQAPGQYNAANGYGNTFLWGTNNGGTTAITAPPGGGNILAGDGDTGLRGAITQNLTGLTVGQNYVLTFYWAAAQQEAFTTATTEGWTVTFGPGTGNTIIYSLPAKGFSGWMKQTFYFTATNASQTLSFLADGTPNGEPPFSLLAGVDLEIVPDFSNWMVFAGFGLACVAFETVRRRRREPQFAPLA